MLMHNDDDDVETLSIINEETERQRGETPLSSLIHLPTSPPALPCPPPPLLPLPPDILLNSLQFPLNCLAYPFPSHSIPSHHIMGLFSKKKAKEPSPPPTVPTSTSRPASRQFLGGRHHQHQQQQQPPPSHHHPDPFTHDPLAPSSLSSSSPIWEQHATSNPTGPYVRGGEQSVPSDAAAVTTVPLASWAGSPRGGGADTDTDWVRSLPLFPSNHYFLVWYPRVHARESTEVLRRWVLDRYDGPKRMLHSILAACGWLMN